MEGEARATPTKPRGAASGVEREADERVSDLSLPVAVEALVSLADLRDGFSAGHSEMFVGLADAVGRALRLDEPELGDLRLAARSHDIGTIGVPDRILHKPGRLDEVEWAMLRRHAVLGAEVLQRVAGLARVAEAVRHHHERWDGSGYPDRLSGTDIPLAARIVGACEAFAALTSDRPHRPAYDRPTALDVLRLGSGSQFDPGVVEALLDAVSRLPEAGVGPSGLEATSRAIKPDRAASRQPPQARLAEAFSRLESLPALAESQERLARLGDGDSASLDAAIRIVEADVALTVAVLRRAGRGPAGSSTRGVPAAIRALGLGAVKELAGGLRTAGSFQRLPGWSVPVEQFRLHAVATQRAATQLARALGRHDVDVLLAGALLHDIGKLVLGLAYPEYPRGIHGSAATPEDRLIAERRELGVDHAVAGGVIARRWFLPAPLPAIIEHHHHSAADGDAAVIRLADMLVHHLHGRAVKPAELSALADRLGIKPAELQSLMHDLGHEVGRPRTADPSPLSRQETAVLAGLSEGKRYKEIAAGLGLSTSTVRSHCHNAYGKLGVADRTQAVLTATAKGWI